MASDYFCPKCGNRIQNGAMYCSRCGTRTPISANRIQSGSTYRKSYSPKSGQVTLTLCMLFGLVGLHRFYAGRFFSGLLMGVTGGGLGVWVLLDLISIVSNNFKDRKGREIIVIEQESVLKKNVFIIAAIFSWIAIIIVSVIAVYYYLTSALIEIVDKQLTAIKEGDFTRAYSYNSYVFQNTVTIQQFKAYIERYPSLKNNQSYSFTERRIKLLAGYLKGTLTSTDGIVLPVVYQFIKEPNGWKITNIFIIPSEAGVNKQ